MSVAPITGKSPCASETDQPLSQIAAEAQTTAHTIRRLADAINEGIDGCSFPEADRAALDRAVLFLRLIDDCASNLADVLDAIERADTTRRRAEQEVR